jgi:hypothetical protein
MSIIDGLLKKADEVRVGISKSVKETVNELKTEKQFLVEQFGSFESISERLNTLQKVMSNVEVQSMVYTDEGYFVLVIKVEA